MTLLTGETEVFSSQPLASSRCVVAFLARRQADTLYSQQDYQQLIALLAQLSEEGWLLSFRAMFTPESAATPMAMDSGFAHPWDISGAFEAPTLSAAIAGTIRLEEAGWAKLFTTEWLIGPREFATVNGSGPDIPRDWGFMAFWEWNDAWCEASAEQRVEYDAECDVAFKGDLALNVNIAGRHRLDWAHNWHHLGIWEIAAPEVADRAITGHEDAADFMFTTSRHVIGRLRPLSELLLPAPY
ncbi:hypothetical protein [Pantoea sp. BAV 3049]|uniref:hypothetical protein n=1 Tax=Pantoea sp. BAV 3049 TaxID=2654188 RepID=UPI00131CBB9C|nr:hypothetical protein [Pantoea sp. BAV 3049]